MLKRGGQGDVFIDLIVKKVREPKAGGQENGTKVPEFEFHSNRRPETTLVTLRSPGRNGRTLTSDISGGSLATGKEDAGTVVRPPTHEGPGVSDPGGRKKGDRNLLSGAEA